VPFDYPDTVAEILRPNIRYRRGVLPLLREFKARHPWRGSVERREALFRFLIDGLAGIYGIPRPRFRFIDVSVSAQPGVSGSSYYSPALHEIGIIGKASVVTTLHEFAHALGKGERGATLWSVNLFRRVFPRQYNRLTTRGHMLLQRG
jgi:hypothetical protein